MAFVTDPKDGGESSEKALVARLRQFVQDSDLSFYKIASRIGTSGGILSMWLSERAKPGPEKLDAIEKFLKG
jgi:transcriptional regulator with XRE-family HTH domain